MENIIALLCTQLAICVYFSACISHSNINLISLTRRSFALLHMFNCELKYTYIHTYIRKPYMQIALQAHGITVLLKSPAPSLFVYSSRIRNFYSSHLLYANYYLIWRLPRLRWPELRQGQILKPRKHTQSLGNYMTDWRRASTMRNAQVKSIYQLHGLRLCFWFSVYNAFPMQMIDRYFVFTAI